MHVVGVGMSLHFPHAVSFTDFLMLFGVSSAFLFAIRATFIVT